MLPVGRYRMKEHTADLALEVQGESPADLFASAAAGFYRAIVQEPPRRGAERHEVSCRGADREELLVRFLSELLYLYATRGFLAAAIEIRDCSEQALEAHLIGERFDPARHTILREIKAITHHGLRVERAAQGWSATVIMDV